MSVPMKRHLTRAGVITAIVLLACIARVYMPGAEFFFVGWAAADIVNDFVP